MSSCLKLALLLVFVLSAAPFISPASAESINYVYDELNRLTRTEFGDGTAIACSYDEIGNRTQKYIQATTCSNLPVKMAAAYYSTLQSSYVAAVDGTALQTMSIDFNENLNLNRNVSVTLDGGYGCDYTTNLNYSVINGTLTILYGTVTVSNIIVR